VLLKLKLNLRKIYTDADFIKIRNFLSSSYKNNPQHHNWHIDRWNYCRFMVQVSNNSFDSWPETVGIWTDENNNIVAVVNSEGEKRGEVFFQIGNINPSDTLLNEMIDYAETKLFIRKNSNKYILLGSSNSKKLSKILKNRNYSLADWKENNLSLEISKEFDIKLPENFKVVDSTLVSNYQKGLAHAKANGYHKDINKINNAERAYKSLRKAPDYKSNLDLSVINGKNEVVSFCTIWYDKDNQLATLEPVGTIPEYQRKGLAQAVIYEGINQVKRYGATKIEVGSDQKFYYSIGFSFAYKIDIWEKTF